MATNKLARKYALTIMLATLAVLILLVGLQLIQLGSAANRLTTQSQQSFANKTEMQLRQRGESLAEYLSNDVSTPFLALDMVTLHDLIAPVSESTGVINVFLYGGDGRVVHDGTREISRYGDNIVQLYPGLQPAEAADQFLRLDTSMVIVRPVMTETTHLGGVVIELSTEDYSASLTAVRERLDLIASMSMTAILWQLALAGTVIVLLAALFAVIAGRRLAQPIKLLAEQAERIGSGDYQSAMELVRDDEVGDLAAAFERMRINLREQTERIEYQAFYDALTGLRNRASFHQVMSELFVKTRPGTKHVLLYLGIDGFKRINDGLGHGAGDRLLKKVARRLSSWAARYPHDAAGKSSCELARWDGDQFAVLLKTVGSVEAVHAQAQQLLKELARPHNVAGMEVVMSTSIGYAVFPDDAKDSDTLITYADLAMYKSKERGHNNVSAYLSKPGVGARTSLVLESEIRAALADEQFELIYYPMIDTTSRAVIGLEVKVIWNHPERGRLGPRDYFAVASTAGLLPQLRGWVCNRGLDKLRKWQDAGYANLHMTFDLANVDFDPDWLREMVADGLERTQIDSQDVFFEIHEAGFSNDILRSAELLQYLKKFGISVWINNFGIGYSSINRLRRVPLAGIKLHHSVVRDLDSSKDSQNMVTASIAMAHGFGIQAAADGVINEQQIVFLRQKGCDIVQGEFVSPALGAAEVDIYLARSYAGPRLVRSLRDA